MKVNKIPFLLSLPVISLLSTQLVAQKVEKTVKTGKGVYEVAYSEKTNSVYVAATGGRGENNARIYKVDGTTLKIQDSIDVNEAPGFGIGINDKTQTLYTSNTRTNSVSAIDLKTKKVTKISNGQEKSHTREVVVDEINNKIYVSDISAGIWVIDGNTNKFSHMIDNAGPSYTGLALDSKEQKMYIVSMKTNKIVAYDLKKNVVIDSFATGSTGAINVTRDPKTNRLFVSHQGSGEVTVLEAATGKLLKTIPVGKGALGINYNAAKDVVYVANRGDGTVSVIDAKTYAVKATLESGSHPNTVVSSSKGLAYVTNKAKSQPRPAQGEAPKPPVEDVNGDVLTLIK